MKITVIDGQGGGLGRMLTEAIISRFPDAELTAVGTNAIATAAMVKSGARRAATGENAAVIAARDADYIVGPIGIVLADALLGEITPRMAVAVGQSRAKRILIPMTKCETSVAGVREMSIAALIEDALDKIN